jgi:hypothetical protein
MSTVQDIKSIKSTYGILELIEKSYDLDYSDTRLKQIEALLKSLTDKEPLLNDTLKVEPMYAKTISEYIKSLNLNK